jgi:regulatory Fis family protein
VRTLCITLWLQFETAAQGVQQIAALRQLHSPRCAAASSQVSREAAPHAECRVRRNGSARDHSRPTSETPISMSTCCITQPPRGVADKRQYMAGDDFICAIIDVLQDRDIELAIDCALQILIARSDAQLARIELRERDQVVYARESGSVFASHPAFDSAYKLRNDIGVPAVGTILIAGFMDLEAIRDLVALFACALGTQADRIIRHACDRPPLMLHDAVRLFEQRFVREVLNRYRGNMAATARTLGIARSTLYELVRDREVPGSAQCGALLVGPKSRR